MNEELKNMELWVNKDRHRFELRFGDKTAYIEYGHKENIITLFHTKVPDEMEGQGVGSTLIEKTLKYIEKNNYKLIPLCPFVVAYLKRHPEWNRLVEEKKK